MTPITIRKLDHAGRQVTAYPGQVLRRKDHTIVLRTSWNRAPLDVGYVVLEPGDRWTEHFYADRWYNIFEIRAGDGRLKGWYCNITRPACISAHEVTAESKYLDAADRFAQQGVERFLGDGRPLPKASHVHDHYEAVTNGDTLMLALLRLWQVQNKPTLKLNPVFTDR